jgi:hypothetical protein
MESLEAELQKVERLEEDLSAKVKIGEHFEEHEGNWVGGSRGGNNPGYYETEPWNERVDDYKPNLAKVESAKKKLLECHNSSKWRSIRFKAAVALAEENCLKRGELQDTYDEAFSYWNKQLVCGDESARQVAIEDISTMLSYGWKSIFGGKNKNNPQYLVSLIPGQHA